MSILYCDGGMNPKTGDEAWGSVVEVKYGKVIDLLGLTKHEGLFKDFKLREEKLSRDVRKIIPCKFNDVKSQQNNGAELLSMVAALRIALESKEYKVIMSDSKLIIDYWSKDHVASATRKKMDPAKLQYIKECNSLRITFESIGGRIEYVRGSDNPADLGWHR